MTEQNDIEMTTEEMFQREADVQEGSELYVDNLPATCTQYKFEQLFASYGTNEKCLFRQHQTGTRTGYGFVTLKTSDAANKALKALNGSFMDGHNFRVMLCKKPAELVSNKNLYVCDLPESCSKVQLENLFSDFGEIAECRVLIDGNTQQARGVGFIHYKQAGSAKSAMGTLNGTVPPQGSKPLLIRYARESKRGRGRGRGRGGGGRGGYGPMRSGFGGGGGRFNPMSGFGGGWDPCGFGGYGGPPQQGGFGGDFGGRGGFGGRGRGRGGGGRSDGFEQKKSNRNIYVSQFPSVWGELQLRDIFSSFGSIEVCNVNTQQDAGPNRGVGFVHFSDSNAAAAAVEAMDGSTPSNAESPISVRLANRGGNMANSGEPERAPMGPPMGRPMGPPMGSMSYGGTFSNPVKGPPTGGPGKVCRFFSEGRCKKGSSCEFSHSNSGGAGAAGYNAGPPAPAAFGYGAPPQMTAGYGPGGGAGFGGSGYNQNAFAGTPANPSAGGYGGNVTPGGYGGTTGGDGGYGANPSGFGSNPAAGYGGFPPIGGGYQGGGGSAYF